MNLSYLDKLIKTTKHYSNYPAREKQNLYKNTNQAENHTSYGRPLQSHKTINSDIGQLENEIVQSTKKMTVIKHVNNQKFKGFPIYHYRQEKQILQRL